MIMQTEDRIKNLYIIVCLKVFKIDSIDLIEISAQKVNLK